MKDYVMKLYRFRVGYAVFVEFLKNIFIYYFIEIMCLRFRFVFSFVEIKYELGDFFGRFCIVGVGKVIIRRYVELIK